MPDAIVDLISSSGKEARGEIANGIVMSGRLNAGMMRPYLAVNSRGLIVPCVTVFKGGDPKNPKNYVTKQIQANATLRRDEWKQLDDAIMEVSRQRLGGIDDLISKGLTYNLGNAMGTTVLEWHDVDDPGEAVLTMDGVTRGKNDRPNFQHNYLPIPIIHSDYEINARVLAASRNMGNPLDTTLAERAARRVNEKLEDMLFTNTSYSFGEKDSREVNTIYSYINFPDRNTVTLSTNWDDLDFDSSTANGGGTIVENVMDMKQASIDDYHYGPWMLYIPTNYETTLDKDYDRTTPGTTIRERIMKIDGITGIKVIDRLPADNVLLVQMTSDVVRLVRGMGLTNIEWQEEGRFVSKYKVLTIQVPQIRSDQNKRCGIVHLAA
jgi:hypothetical protein